jgi:glycosyltransferase 2 family protein
VDAIALVLASSVVLLGIHPKPDWLGDASRVTAVAAGIGLLAIVILPHTGNLCEAVIRRLPLPAGLRERLIGFAGQILLGLRAFHSIQRLTMFVVWTVVIWTLDCFSAMVCSRGLGLDLSFPVALLLLTGLGLGSALPSTPGYVGIFQFVAVSVLTPFGVSRDAALAYILVTQALGYIVVIAFGLPGLYKFKGWRQAAEQSA